MTQTDFTSDGNLPIGTVAVVVVAAGSGVRLGAGVPKAFVELAGSTLLERSQELAVGLERPVWLVSVVPGDLVSQPRSLAGHDLVAGHVVVAGGANRQESVAAGLAAIPDGIDYVLVHDAARALTPVDVFGRVLAALESGARAVVPAVPVADTIKQVVDRDGSEVVIATPDRATLRAIQTPQGFALTTLHELHANVDLGGVTDDAGLAERAGVPVEVVAGSPAAFKITTAHDLEYARYVLNAGGRFV